MPSRRCRSESPIPFLIICVALATACGDSAGPADQQYATGQPDVGSGVFTAVSTGDNTTCALDEMGRAYCWGDNFRGRLATGDAADRVTAPRLVSNQPAAFNQISVGAEHQCALAYDGQAYCWGQNGSGQLGAGGPAQGVTAVVGGLTFTSISAGFRHTCAITTDQRSYCWGENTYGQLGAGAAAPCDYSSLPCLVNAPVTVAGELQFVQITAGSDHTCGLTSDGTAYCWGENTDGELGNPAIPVHCGMFPSHSQCLRDSPTPITGGLKFAKLSAGASHTCGITTIGKAYCWGLTADSVTNAIALNQAPATVSGGLTFREVTAGNGVSCGLTVDGQAVCWGRNNFGQMGIGSIAPFFTATPLVVHMPAVQSAPAIGVDYHACALTTTKRIWCWGGNNFSGELGSKPLGEPGVVPDIRTFPTPLDPPT